MGKDKATLELGFGVIAIPEVLHIAITCPGILRIEGDCKCQSTRLRMSSFWGIRASRPFVF